MKFLVTLFALVAVTSAFAEGVQGVTERVTCSDIQDMINELSAVEDPDADILAELEKQKVEYRRKCSRSAAKRKSAAVKNVVIAANSVPEEIVVKEVVVEEPVSDEVQVVYADENLANPIIVTEEAVVEEYVDEEALLAQELAYLEAGLCVDGTEPNKFGCCEGEIFKDLGNSVFACCPKSGDGECFLPIE